MTAFQLDTFYQIIDTDGITFTIDTHITSIPTTLFWWIWSGGQIRQGATSGGNTIEITEDYYPYDDTGPYQQAKAVPFDFRYGAPYTMVPLRDPSLTQFDTLFDVFPPDGTNVKFTLPPDDTTIYTGSIIRGDGIFIQNIQPELPLVENFFPLVLIQPSQQQPGINFLLAP